MNRVLSDSVKKHQDICQNCEQLYFKRFRTFKENFCSLDCKSSFIYMKTEIQNRIINYIEYDDTISDFINFSNSSMASDLNKKSLRYNYMKSVDFIYNKQYNHSDFQITL